MCFLCFCFLSSLVVQMYVLYIFVYEALWKYTKFQYHLHSLKKKKNSTKWHQAFWCTSFLFQLSWKKKKKLSWKVMAVCVVESVLIQAVSPWQKLTFALEFSWRYQSEIIQSSLNDKLSGADLDLFLDFNLFTVTAVSERSNWSCIIIFADDVSEFRLEL